MQSVRHVGRVAELGSLGVMKAIAFKTFVGLLGAFAAYYAYFLGSAFYELYRPSSFPGFHCGTGAVWALQGGALFFAPLALIASVGLWFVGRGQTVGIGFSRASRVELVILMLCALVNLVIFIQT